MDGIFISYRRQDAPGHAGRLYDRLGATFGADRVFMDVAGDIEPGLPFDEVIQQAVGSCEVLLVVIGSRWLDVKDERGRRRLDDEDDYLRLETSTALARGIRVIPVLVAKARMPRAEDLPDDIAPLARRQAIELSDERWSFDVDRLVRVLEGVLDEAVTGVGREEAGSAHADETGSAEGDETGEDAAAEGADGTDSAGPPSFRDRWARASLPVKIAALGALGLLAAWSVFSTGWSDGSAEGIAVPDLYGVPFATAASTLDRLGLVVGDTTSERSDSLPPGAVLGQGPEAGHRVEAGTEIKLLLAAGLPAGEVPSTGATRGEDAGGATGAAGPRSDAREGGRLPSETPEGVEGTVIVPDVVGRPPRDAMLALQAAGLSPKLEFRTTASDDLGEVSRQSPPEGSRADSGAVVRLMATQSEPLEVWEREAGFRYLSLSEVLTFDPLEEGRPVASLVLREGEARYEGARRFDGLYLAPGVDVDLVRSGGSEPSQRACDAGFRTVEAGREPPIENVPVHASFVGDVFCVRTAAGTGAAVWIRRLIEPPDEDGDRVLVGYRVWR